MTIFEKESTQNIMTQFDFINNRFQKIKREATVAENHIDNGNVSAGAQRRALELIVDNIFKFEGVPIPVEDTLFARLKSLEPVVDEQILRLMHTIRKVGNAGAHAMEEVSANKAIRGLNALKSLCLWFNDKYAHAHRPTTSRNKTNNSDSTWICIDCSKSNQATAQYCIECGFNYAKYRRELIEEEREHKRIMRLQAEQEADRLAGVSKCPKCNYKNPLSANFCGSCRVNIRQFENAQSLHERKLQDSRLKLYTIVGAILGCGILLLYEYVYSGMTDNGYPPSAYDFLLATIPAATAALAAQLFFGNLKFILLRSYLYATVYQLIMGVTATIPLLIISTLIGYQVNDTVYLIATYAAFIFGCVNGAIKATR